MDFRLRENPKQVFECFCEVVIPPSNNENCWILQKFPDSFKDEEMLKSIMEFSYPCEFNNKAVQHFSFVLTSIDSKWTFGYCRHSPQAPNFFVIISCFPWHETFCRVLNHIAELTDHREPAELGQFLQALYNIEVPEPGSNLHVAYNQGKNEFIAITPDHHKLPSIPEDRNLTEYFSAISVNNMMTVFASMLHERRILVTSKKLSQLTACVQAANLLIYPMCWQHIFIPILPKHLLDYVSAPMPFLIGVPSSTMSRINTSELGDVVILYADINKVETPFNDLESLPSEIVQTLKKNLKHENVLLGDGLSRAFLRALVQLTGGYREALRLQLGEKISFSSEAFIQTRPLSMRPFLEEMLNLQIFQQFIDGRLEMLNTGQGFGDEFELEVNMYGEKPGNKLKTQYKEWLQTMKKEGGAFLKTVRHKVRDKGKRAYKDLRSKLHDMQVQKGSLDDVMIGNEKSHPRSAPSSPTLARPLSMHVSKKSKTRNVKEESMRQAIEELKTSTAFRNAKVQHYNLLYPEEGFRDSEDSVSDTETSSGFQLQRLDMDLLGDLQDLIFRRCSISLSEEKSTSEDNPTPPLPPKAENHPESISILPPPVPKPRTKRKPVPARTPPLQKDTDGNEGSEADAPLIKLDPTDDIFDPLQEGYQTTLVDSKPLSDLSDILNSLPARSCSPSYFQGTSNFVSNSFVNAVTSPSQSNSCFSQDFNTFSSSNQLYSQIPSVPVASNNPFDSYKQPVESVGRNQDKNAHSSTSLPRQECKSPSVFENSISTDDQFADLVNWQVSNLSKSGEEKCDTRSTWEQFQ